MKYFVQQSAVSILAREHVRQRDVDIYLLQIPFILSNTPRPFIEGFIGIGAFFINYQLLVPISLYITVEIIKALQIYFISNDIQLYDQKSASQLELEN